MTDPYGHFIHTSELFFKGHYLKLTRYEVLNNKTPNLSDLYIIPPPDDVYDTYVEIYKDLQLSINIYNALVVKAYIWFDIGDILHSSFISYFHVSLKT